MPKINLTPLQKKILGFFGQNSFGRNFYWTGGTLLAYRYFNHRQSADLDFFSPDIFPEDDYLIFINRLKKQTRAEKITLTKKQNRRIYLIRDKKEAVKIELVYFPFLALEKRMLIKEFGVAGDSLTDVMANKILSVYQRDEVKDIYDLYYYLTHKPKYSLGKLSSLEEKKFGVEIESSLFLAKASELADRIKVLEPLLIKKDRNLHRKIKQYLQKTFNKEAGKFIK